MKQSYGVYRKRQGNTVNRILFKFKNKFTEIRNFMSNEALEQINILISKFKIKL